MERIEDLEVDLGREVRRLLRECEREEWDSVEVLMRALGEVVRLGEELRLER